MTPTIPQQSISPEMQLLLHALSWSSEEAQRQRISELVAAPLNWQLFNELAVYHGVCPQIDERLAGPFAGTADDINIDLIRAETSVVQRKSMMLLAELFNIQRMFEQQGIECRFIKGPLTSLSFYPQFKLRGFRDIDVMVRKKDVAAASDVLETYGYTLHPPEGIAALNHTGRSDHIRDIVRHFSYEAEFVGRNDMAIIDLHWRLLPDILPAESLFQYSYRQPVGSQSINTLTPEVQFVITCVHAAKHRWSRLIWIADIAAMMSSDVDWDQICTIARSWGMFNVVLGSVHIAHELLAVPMPDHPQLRDPLSPSLSGQLQEDMSDMLQVERIQRALIESLRRTWRLSDTHFQALQMVLGDLLRPRLPSMAKLPLPRRLFGLYYAISPVVDFGTRAGRQFGKRSQKTNSK